MTARDAFERSRRLAKLEIARSLLRDAEREAANLDFERAASYRAGARRLIDQYDEETK